MIDICTKHNIWFDNYHQTGRTLPCYFSKCPDRESKNHIICIHLNPCVGSTKYPRHRCDECIVKFYCYTKER
jgi:hypothetical protein